MTRIIKSYISLLILLTGIPCFGQDLDTITQETDTVFITTEPGDQNLDTIKLETDTVFIATEPVDQDLDTIKRETDTVFITTEPVDEDSIFFASHSPKKAAVYSAVFPGLGQIYNRKYWKVPIVYVGFAGCIAATIYNANEYTFFKDAYKYMLDNDLEVWDGITKLQAEVYKDYHRRYRDLFIIITVGFYGFQIIDATVDAHLIDYDIGDNLSLVVDPTLMQTPTGIHSVGLKCCLSF